jgi:DNA polymerase-3 subunit delta
LFKSLGESGLQIDCKAPASAALVKWLGKWAKKKYSAQLEAEAAEQMLELVGPEMGLLDQELAKLALVVKGAASEPGTATSGGKITAMLVRDTVGGGRAKSVWDMLDLAADGHAAEAIVELDRLLAAGDHPVAILGPMAASLRRFASAARYFEQAEQNRQRTTLRHALEQAGVKTWPAAMEKAERQLRQLGRRRAAQLYRRLLDADLALKGSSSSGDRARLVLEQLIVGLSTQTAAKQ